MERFKKYLPYLSVFILIVLTVFVWYFVLNYRKTNYLKVVFLDVGQGDSIYIEAPNGKQILIDGGPDAKTLSSLSKVMPFADRSIDVILMTHPDFDHIGGAPLLLSQYKVSTVIENGNTSTSETFLNLENKIKNKKINKVIATKGMKIILDKKRNIYLDIIYPDRDTTDLSSNDSSIVGRLVYNKKSFMFMGDASLYVENLLEWDNSSEVIDSDVLKLGHHGAKTSSSISWLKEVSPVWAVISAGKNNKYNHPSDEVIERLNNLNISYLSTQTNGNLIFKTDGFNLFSNN